MTDDEAQEMGRYDYRSDLRPTEELIRIALIGLAIDDYDRDFDAWPPEVKAGHRARCVLHARGSNEVLDAAAQLCDSAAPLERELGAHILGQLGEGRPYREQCCDRLLLLLTDQHERVRLEAFYALGHLGNRRADKALAGHADDPDPKIRRATAFALNGTTDPDGIRALLGLMRDPQAETRDWATTGIGQDTTIDGPDIRAALLERTDDDDTITRAEALLGLARRKDPRALPFLITELQGHLDPSDDREEKHLDYKFHAAGCTMLGWPDDDWRQSDVAALIGLLRAVQASTA